MWQSYVSQFRSAAWWSNQSSIEVHSALVSVHWSKITSKVHRVVQLYQTTAQVSLSALQRTSRSIYTTMICHKQYADLSPHLLGPLLLSALPVYLSITFKYPVFKHTVFSHCDYEEKNKEKVQRCTCHCGASNQRRRSKTSIKRGKEHHGSLIKGEAEESEW